MMHTTRWLMATAVLATFALPGQAQNPAPRPPREQRTMGQPGMLPLERLRTQLELTDEQVKKLQALRSTQAAKPSREPDLLRARADLMQAMQGTGDLAAARKAIERMNALRTDGMMSRLEQRQAMLGILTSEQRTKLSTMRRMRGGRGMRMYGGREWRGMGPMGRRGGMGRMDGRGGGAPGMGGRGMMGPGMRGPRGESAMPAAPTPRRTPGEGTGI
jgi:Spy/CpxP family protein refolding chaperone